MKYDNEVALHPAVLYKRQEVYVDEITAMHLCWRRA